jgi:Tol biopolymer transport system component
VPVYRLTFATACALAAAAIFVSGATAAPVTYNGISADGSVAVFSTAESLVPGDTDRERDVYERSYDEALERYVTREVSIGPTGGNDALPAQFDAVSADGGSVFFNTKEPLVAGDTDHASDIYRRDLATKTTTLVSRGAAACEAQGCGNGPNDASFAPGGLSPDGEKLFFVTDERLSPSDNDSSPDIYVRDLGPTPATALVSAGAPDCASQGCGEGDFGVTFNAVSADGSTVVFSSDEPLAEADEDQLQDVYVRDLSTEMTELVSTPGTCPVAIDCKAVFGGVSADGSHVFFESSERIAAGDTDQSQDVYDWTSSGGPALASTAPGTGNEGFAATFRADSSDGSAVYFETSEALDPAADTDGEERDVYERSGGTTTLISTGPTGGDGPYPASLRWVSPDGSSAAVLFTTSEALTSDDEDSSQDVYERLGSTTTLISKSAEGGDGAFDATFAKAAHDASHVLFVTAEKLLAADTDSSSDIYDASGGEVALISTGPEGGNGNHPAGLAGLSVDGLRAFFTTEERLTEGDPDAEADIYERSGSTTRLVSVGNVGALGPNTPTLTATNPASPAPSTTPHVLGEAQAGTWVKLYSTFECSGDPVAQGTVEELEGEGIAVTVAQGSTNSFRATAEVEGLVSPCSAPIAYKQENPPPPADEEPQQGGGGTEQPSGSVTGGTSGSGSKSGSKSHVGEATLVMPQTLITFGPASKTRKRKVVFRFDDATGQAGSTFVCKVDRHRWGSCSSPKRIAKLKRGRHVFAVKAINAAGVPDDQPAKRSFKVVR